MKKLSKSSQEWFKRMKNVKDDGSEPIDNVDLRAMNEFYNKRFYATGDNQ